MISFQQLFDAWTFTWVILPLLIFTARVCDVSIGTLRIIFVSRGHRVAAPLLGFFEVLIWLMAIGKIMQNLSNVMAYVSYAGGFAMGNFVGIWIEQKLAVGMVVLRVITRKGASTLIAELKSRGYGVTSIDAEGNEGPVNIVYSVLKRNVLETVIGLVEKMNPKAFYSIEDVRAVSEGIFPRSRPMAQKKYLRLMRKRRKGK